VENDRLSRDLNEAATLVHEKDAELTKLVQSLSDSAEIRDHLKLRLEKLEKDSQTSKVGFHFVLDKLNFYRFALLRTI